MSGNETKTDETISTESPVRSFQQMMVIEIMKNFLTCNATVLHNPYPDDGELYCNATFDGYTCWDYARAGTRVYGECPDFMVFQFGQHSGLPFKDCNIDGTWYKHPDTHKPWTDYSPCTYTEKVQRARNVLYVYFGGYGLSIVALVLALFIFTYFRQLKCTRVTIHKHLFLSYTLTATLWISYYATSSFDPHVYEDNPVWCRVLHVVAQYVTVCNYAWMFCEGFYLHTILVSAFTKDKFLLKICYAIGWGVPILPTIIYSILRSTHSSMNNKCWNDDTNLKWIFSGPILLSLLVNAMFLINILRILCSKVRSIRQPESNPLRQSIRATCILIPLLGIQYFALPFRPDGDGSGTYIYDIISACFSSFQGFLVSVLFCFINGEVFGLFRDKIQILRRRPINRSSSTVKSIVYSAVQMSDENPHAKIGDRTKTEPRLTDLPSVDIDSI